MTISPDAFPETVSAPVKALLTEFIDLSNAPSAHSGREKDEQALVELFTDDGVYEFAGKKSVGHEEINTRRASLFSNIPHRDHPIVKVYTYGSDDRELMVLGRVGYKFHNQADHSTDWAGKYSIVECPDGKLRFKSMQIVLNPAHENER